MSEGLHRHVPTGSGRRVDRVVRSLSGVMLALGTVAVLAILLVIVVNVAWRQFTGRAVPGSFEISRLLMPVVVFGGMAWTFLEVGNFRMDAVRKRLPAAARSVGDVIQVLLAFAVFGVLGWLTVRDAARSVAEGEYEPGAIDVPIYPTRILLAAGCVVTAIAILHGLTSRWRTPSGVEMPQDIVRGAE